ncbi:MAG: tetratricopeptide repeat protein [Acidobacteria bacterium]|nr:tetratricopeptide repeat protein [Acidobacteriota bacterium]
MDAAKPNINDAVKLHQAGRLDEAEAVYRQILAVEPAQSDAIHLLGVIAYQRKRFDEAIDLIGRAIALNKRIADYHNNLGNVFLAQHRLKEAEDCYRRALKLNPGYSDAHNNMGNVLKDLGKFEEAASSYERALRFNPKRAEIHNNVGMVLERLGRYEDAVRHYREAVHLKPDFCDAYANMGSALKSQGRLQEAVESCAKALQINPAHALALFNMGNALAQGGKIEQGVAYYRKALQADPNLSEAHLNLGHALCDEGKKEEAAVHMQQALLLKPDSLTARFGHCIRRIPLIHDSFEEIAQVRSDYRRELEELRKWIDLTDPGMIRQAPRIVGNCQPFFLAYQGQNDRELQSLYGDLMVRIQSACFPAWSKRRPLPPRKPGERLRVGIVSGFFFLHSNWKIPIKGWIENLNKDDFQLYGYYTGREVDSQTEIARKSFFRFYENADSLNQWCEWISKDRLHVLIFPEVGMDPMTVRLASLRLAPVQCTSWGHPDTSGLPTIDYYLSSDLMEPDGADSHYTEQLVRLPNLSIYYEPLSLEPAPLCRSDMGLRDDSILFLCLQSLFKYLPQFDDVFPRIALKVGSCQFAFLSFVRSAQLGERFMRRLAKAFARHGLKCEDYVGFLPHLAPRDYQGLNRIADIFLDSIGWSGCNSTLEALNHNLPVVTTPGNLMRGRHSCAILSMAGLNEMIAKDIDEYVSLASRLATDSSLRGQFAEKISRHKQLIYRDMDCIRGLEDFLRRIVV